MDSRTTPSTPPHPHSPSPNAPSTSIAFHHHPYQPYSVPTSSPPQPSSTPNQPSVFFVPRNPRQIILYFSQNSRTPESKAKRAILSSDPNQNAIALVGMGGAGKTTILRALGHDADVRAKFRDGVWFIQLGHDAPVQKLLDQLEEIIAEAFPDFLPTFTRLTANPNKHLNMMNKLIDLLATKRFLLIFDDVWDLDSNVYRLVDSVCTAVQMMEGAYCKVLTSTRNEEIGRILTHDMSVTVSPEDSKRETCVEILCCYAGIHRNTIPTFSPCSQQALDSVIDMCAGLPLALSVAGSAIGDVLITDTTACEQNGIVQYWESLKTSSRHLSDAERGSRHCGLNVAVESSLASLEKKWEGKNMTVGAMFRSFCIMEKQMILPLHAIEKLWGVCDALSGVLMFSRHSIVSVVQDEGGSVVGVRMHDLVHDLCVEMAEGSESVRKWHTKLVDAYRVSFMTKERTRNQDNSGDSVPAGTGDDEWWKLDNKDKYMRDGIVRHLLGAGRVTEALRLLTDYRWVENLNEDEKRPPFLKIIAELQLLQRYLEKNEKTETGRRIVSDIEILMRSMKLCMIPHCIRNRKECTFQIYGRLHDARSESDIARRLMCSIERYGRRPWVRAGPGVLTNGRSLLQRVLKPGYVTSMSVGAEGEELVVGVSSGKNVWLLNGQDGSQKVSLAGHDYRVVEVDVDRSCGLIYSCDRGGRVIVWKKYKEWRSFQAEGLREPEGIRCMQVLRSVGRVVLGTEAGRLMAIDVESGDTVRTVDTRTKGVISLTVGGGEKVVMAGLGEGIIRVWDTSSFEVGDNVLGGHYRYVNRIAMSVDGRLLAFASHCYTVNLWNIEKREQLWSSNNQGSSIESVLFSSDGRLLYSAVYKHAICVWRVRDGGRDVSLAHTLRHSAIYGVKSLCITDDWELFVSNWNGIHVWDARDNGYGSPEFDVLLPHIENFACSADGATLLTYNEDSECLEIRNVCDVWGHPDRVVSTFKRPSLVSTWLPSAIAVSNDQKFVAVSEFPRAIVHVVDARNGVLLHSLSDLDEWASAVADREKPSPTASQGSHDSSVPADFVRQSNTYSLSFSADSSIVSAEVDVGFPGEIIDSKEQSWNVSSGEPLDASDLNVQSDASNSTAESSIVSDWHSPILEVARNDEEVTYAHEGQPFTIATLEDSVEHSQYCPSTSRLWFSASERGMQYVDLILENTQLTPCDDPPLLPLQQPLPSPSQEVYDVFISHAGTDKFTIAKLLYDLLVALGYKVFLDMSELKPGNNAPQKMVNAMQTAKIAVVILSPEFAARKWTMKELMCFLERFRADGERGVIIIPVFYRLSLSECKDQKLLAGLRNEEGEFALAADGILERLGQEGHYGMEEIMRALKEVTIITGIENKEGVTNGRSEEEEEKRKVFVESIVKAIVDANGRLEGRAAAGPSS